MKFRLAIHPFSSLKNKKIEKFNDPPYARKKGKHYDSKIKEDVM